MASSKSPTVAVIGAGIAGAACARALASAGHQVHVFDKSRGPGGRMATRRIEWVDGQGQAQTVRLDHGAVGISATTAAFAAFIIEQAAAAGDLVHWAPKLAAGSLPLGCGDRIHVPVPDMPALCRRLLDGVPATWSLAVDRLVKGPLGWQVYAGGELLHGPFDIVVLAVPPAQAAPLLGPHRRDWAARAAAVKMHPCWTLIGMADETQDVPDSASRWDVARPPTGPLACVLRTDLRPGRVRITGQAHWVAHARAGFSRRHLERPAPWVQEQMQSALAEWLGRPVAWRHCLVHRWRYAFPHRPARTPSAVETLWWDGAQGLGVCGDFLGGPSVEGAWLSGQALAAAVRSVTPQAPVDARALGTLALASPEVPPRG